jgi:hypothetical protein
MKTPIEDFVGRDWLFKHIDDWLRHKKNERFLILTGEPGVGISTISTQLVKRNYLKAYHFCKAGDVETTKSSYIVRSLAVQLGQNLPNYGQALARTIKPVDLQAEVNICIDSMSESQITKLYIQNLKPNDPENLLEILIRLPLINLQQQRNNVIILIDSLYEAAITGDENIIRLLSQLYNLDLPNWVRFIFTSRPKDPLLREFTDVTPYYIENTSEENLADIWQYIEERFLAPSLQYILSKAKFTSGILSSQIAQLARGNFLYTKLLIDNIAAEQQSLDDLDELPVSIDDIYHNYLKCINVEEWQNLYQPILEKLTVTQQPLTQEQLKTFTGIDTEILCKCLERLHQILDVNTDVEGNNTYAIFDQTLREYLHDQKRSGSFWCDANSQHNLIIQHYKKDTAWEEVDWKQVDNYGLLHLVRHLDAARREEELVVLLTSSEKWMDAKFNAFSSHAPYIDDLELAINKFPKFLQPNQLRILIKRYVALRNVVGERVEMGQRCVFFIQEQAPK